MQVWDAVAGEELHSFAHSHIVKAVDFSPSSTELLTGSNEKLLKIFDITKPEAGETLRGGKEGKMRQNRK